MRFASKSPKLVKQNLSQQKQQSKATNNYIEKSLLNKEVEYWKQKYMELEDFCQGKQSYAKLENELLIWKSKYQQLSLRARVAKGSELIIQEYQSRIQELSQQQINPYNSISYSPQKKIDFNKDQIIESQQNEIKILQNQIDELKVSRPQTKRELMNTTIGSEFTSFHLNSYQFQNTQQLSQKLESDLKSLEQENERLNDEIIQCREIIDNQLKLIEQLKTQITTFETQYASEKLKNLKLQDESNQIQNEQQIKKLTEEILNLTQKLRDFDKQKRQELSMKDDHYAEIINQLKNQIQNQIQSGEMRLTTLHNILKDKQQNQSFGHIGTDSFSQSNTIQQQDIKIDTQIKSKDNNKKFYY